MTDKQHLDVSKSNSDDLLLELYHALSNRNKPKPGSFSSLSAVERREYYRLSRRRSRDQVRKAAEAGALAPTAANVRDALADAALMILATDAPGADLVMQVLAGVFQARPGVPISVQMKAKSGKLRPKLTARGGQ